MERVSVIIPGYNLADYAVKAVESVLSQTYKNIEIVFVDDGSTDNTRERLAPYIGRIKYIYKENGGVCSARNRGIRESSGEFITLVDCDDAYLQTKVEVCAKFLRDHPDYGLVHTDAYIIDENDNAIGLDRHPGRRHTGWITDKLLMTNFICNPTSMFRRECLKKAGMYDENLFPPADWDLWLRISEHYKVGYVDQPLSKYRVISNSCFHGLERTRKENKIVLDKFFVRNPKASRRLRQAAYARYHLSMAQCYFLKEDNEQFKEQLWASVKDDPLNFRAAAVFLYYFFARDSFRSMLQKKILRVSLKP